MLRIFSLVSFLILLLPFFQTCSDQNITESTILKNSPLSEQVDVINDVESNQKQYNLSFDELTSKKRKAINNLLKLKKDLTQNGYQIGFIFIEDIKSFQWSVLPFSMSILLSISISIYSFLKNPKVIFALALINIILLLSQLVILYFGKILEDIEQIKIGYYLLLLNMLFIAFVANQSERQNIR